MKKRSASGKASRDATPDGSRITAKRVTLKQVAADLELSPTTVSLVLNRSPAAASIPAETHERVIESAKRLGYRPDFVARSLRSRRSFSIGVLMPEISEGYAGDVLSGIEDHLLDEGYFYLVASHRSRSDLLDEYMQLLSDRMVEGLILINTPLTRSPGLPTVSIAGHQALVGVTNVVIDNDRAAFLALSYLAELGHRRIAFFKGHAHSADSAPRWQAIVTAARSLGLVVTSDLVLELGSDAVPQRFSPKEAYEEGRAFGSKLLEGGQPFTALFAFNDTSAIGAMRAFVDSGLRVPDDVSVVGFDDIHAAAFQSPSLTTVHQPLRTMGETAGRILLERLSGEGPSTDVVSVDPSLVVRASSGPAKGDSSNQPSDP